MDISVVIPCFNGAGVVGQQLAALAAQDGAPPFEIVFVDDDSTDETLEVVRTYRARLCELRIVPLEQRSGAAHARNVGVEQARGRCLLFCDADDVVDPRWVAALSAALVEHDMVAGAMEYARLNPPATADAVGDRQASGLLVGEPAFLPFAGGGNLGVRREVLQAIGGFDAAMPALEDTDLCFRAQLAGFDLVFEPRAVVHVRLRTSLRSWYRQGRSWGHGTAALHRRFRAAGMPPPNRWRHLLGWFAAGPRLLRVRDRGELMTWVFTQGWRVGRLRHGLEALVRERPRPASARAS